MHDAFKIGDWVHISKDIGKGNLGEIILIYQQTGPQKIAKVKTISDGVYEKLFRNLTLVSQENAMIEMLKFYA